MIVTARSLLVCLAVIGLVVLPGCVEMESSQVVKKDGSGTAKQVVVIDTKQLQALEEMAKNMGGGPGGEEDEDDPEQDLEEMAEAAKHMEGVEVVSYDFNDDKAAGKQTATINLKFDSLEAYFKAGIEDNMKVTLEKTEDGAWLLTREMESDEMPAGGADDPQTVMIKSMVGPFMKDLKLSWSMTLPGTIIETNGQKNEAGNGVSWSMTFDDMFDTKKRKMTVKFKGDGLALKPFSLTPADIEAAVQKAEEAAEKAREAAKEEGVGAGK